MMITQIELDLIHKYIEKSLSEEEVAVFRNKYNSNSEFAKEVKRYTDIKIALKTASSFRVKSPNKPKIIRLSYPKLAVAASLALLIIFGGFFTWRSTQKPYHHKLYADYYENPLEDESKIVSRSAIVEADPVIVDKFNQAIICMENNHFESAIELLNSIPHDKGGILMDEVEWYLALCYLRTGNKNLAVDHFINIFNSNSMYNDQARRIYNEILENK